MRAIAVAAVLTVCIAGCAGRNKRVASEVTPPRAQPTARVESVADERANPHCEQSCVPYGAAPSNVQIVVSLRSDERSSIDPRFEAELRPIADELERLRAPLLACGVNPRPIIVLVQHGGVLSVVFRGRSLPESEAGCLREALTRGLTTWLIREEVTVALLDQNRPMAETGLSKEQIRGVVREHIAEFRQCLLEHLDLDAKSDAEFPLRYPVFFQIGSAGEVRCIEPENRDPTLSEFSCCFLPQMTRWRFPVPEGVDTDALWNVTYPFMVERTPVAEP